MSATPLPEGVRLGSRLSPGKLACVTAGLVVLAGACGCNLLYRRYRSTVRPAGGTLEVRLKEPAPTLWPHLTSRGHPGYSHVDLVRLETWADAPGQRHRERGAGLGASLTRAPLRDFC